MSEQKLELSPSCSLVMNRYESINVTQVSLDYTEHSSDHWHSDTETSIELDEAKAREIVAFLTAAFGLADQGGAGAGKDGEVGR